MDRTIQMQLTRWNCLPTALCVVINHVNNVPNNWISLKKIYDIIGHDGSEIIKELESKGFEDPYKRRAFHLQEIIDVSYKLGFALIPIECQPEINVQIAGKFVYNNTIFSKEKSIARSNDYLMYNNAIIIVNTPSLKGHALAWMINDHNSTYNVIDPSTGESVNKQDFEKYDVKYICILKRFER